MIQITITKVPDKDEVKVECKIEGKPKDCIEESFRIDVAKDKVMENLTDYAISDILDNLGKALFE